MRKYFLIKIQNPLFKLCDIIRKWRLPNYGTCLECKKKQATHDYNGHGYYVCESCNNCLNREFDNGDW